MMCEYSSKDCVYLNKAAIYCRELNRIAVALGTARNLSSVLDLIAKSAVEVLNLKACSLGLLDKKTSTLEVVAIHGLREKHAKATDVPIDTKALKGLPVVVTDFSKWLSPEEAKRRGIVSMLCVPIHTRYDKQGVVCVYSAKRHKFSKTEAEFLKSLGNLGAVAIENARLYERLQRRLMETEALVEISRTLTSTLKPQEVFNAIAKTTTDAMKMKGCIVRLLDEKREKLGLVASYGLSQNFLKKGPIHSAKGLEDARIGRPAIVSDVLADSRLEYPEETIKEGIRCELAVPLKVRSEIIGSIRVFGSAPHQFDEDEIKYLEAIAGQAAIAIENAKLYRISLKNWQDLVQEVWEKSDVWGRTKIEMEEEQSPPGA
jgi:GAF domain-containing protein